MIYTDNKKLDDRFKVDNGLSLCILYSACTLGYYDITSNSVNKFKVSDYNLEKVSPYKIFSETPCIFKDNTGTWYVDNGSLIVSYSPTRRVYEGGKVVERYRISRKV